VAEAQYLALLGGHSVSQYRKVGVEPLQAAELRSAVGASSGLDVVAGLFPQASQRRRVFASSEFLAEGFGG
jgi:hypothetical protein